LVQGKRGVSAPRLAEHLEVTPAVIKKVVKPCGQMKIPRRTAFSVYNVTPKAIEKLRSHPEIRKAQERKQKRSQTSKESAGSAVATRRQRCIETLASRHPELIELYVAIVDKLWSPSSERSLQNQSFYSDYPATLWLALSPRSDYTVWAEDVIANIMWACTKVRTWKVNSFGEQDEPLALRLYRTDCKVDSTLWRDMFAAAIRHMFYEDLPKKQGREKALEDLSKYSERFGSV